MKFLNHLLLWLLTVEVSLYLKFTQPSLSRVTRIRRIDSLADEYRRMAQGNPHQNLVPKFTSSRLQKWLINRRSRCADYPRSAAEDKYLRGRQREAKLLAAKKTPRIHKAPGWALLSLSKWLFAAKTCERVFLQAIIDMQCEYNEALCEGRSHKARWVIIRGRWSF